MRNPGGVLVSTDFDGKVRETDTFTCKHCGSVVFVAARARPADIGGMCKQCSGLICPNCVGKGCTPLEKKIEQMVRGR